MVACVCVCLMICVECLFEFFCDLLCHVWPIVGARTGSRIDFGGNEHLLQTNVCSRIKNLEKRGWGPIISAGLGVSWFLMPLGAWTLGKRVVGIRLGTGHALRSKRGGGSDESSHQPKNARARKTRIETKT